MAHRHLLELLAAGPLLVGKTLVALGLRPTPEGWRNTVGVGLRGEGGKFALSAFGLRPPADPVRALAEFLPTQPAARFRLVHRRSVVRRVPAEPRVIGPRYADGELLAVDGHPDADVAAFNRTRHLPEWERVRPLAGHPLFDAIGVTTETNFAHRFQPPDNTRYRNFGGGPMQFVLRPIGDTVDVWAVCHHAANDGAAVRELLAALTAAWGSTPVPYPPAGTAFEPRRCSVPGEREVYESTGFHDFRPLLAERKDLSGRHGIEIAVGPLLAWRLARRPVFAGERFATTVDVPAIDGYDRAVGMLPVRPADFPDDLPGYAAAYRASVALARVRRGPAWELMRGAELLPPGLYFAMMVADPGRMNREFGSVGLSVLKDARVVIGTVADVGYPAGFLVVGGIEHGVGPVSVKGSREQTATYHAEIAAALTGG